MNCVILIATLLSSLLQEGKEAEFWKLAKGSSWTYRMKEGGSKGKVVLTVTDARKGMFQVESKESGGSVPVAPARSVGARQRRACAGLGQSIALLANARCRQQSQP